MLTNNIPISDEILIEKAKNYFGPICGVEDNFKYSIGWLTKIKER